MVTKRSAHESQSKRTDPLPPIKRMRPERSGGGWVGAPTFIRHLERAGVSLHGLHSLSRGVLHEHLFETDVFEAGLVGHVLRRRDDFEHAVEGADRLSDEMTSASEREIATV